MTDSELRFARRAVRRRPLFLGLSVAGVAVALALAGTPREPAWLIPPM